MDRKFLKMKINQYSEMGQIAYRNRHTLLHNIDEVDRILVEKNITPMSKEFQKEFIEACRVVGEICSYSFKEAFADSSCDDKIKFFNEHWNVSVELECEDKKVSMTLKSLYTACSLSEYLDMKSDVTAKMFQQGNYNKEDLDELLLVMNNNDLEYDISYGDEIEESLDSKCDETDNQMNADTESTDMEVKQVEQIEVTCDVSSLFDMISSADSLRDRASGTETLATEAEDQLDRIYKKLISNAYNGKRSISIDGITEELYRQLKGVLEYNGFMVSEYSNQITVTTESVINLDTECIESSLQSYEELPNADNIAAIADSCRCVIKPRILKDAISRVIAALYRVRLRDSRILISKQETKTNAYDLLYEVLRGKGFDVYDYNDHFVVKW